MATCRECIGSEASGDGPYWVWLRNSSQLCVQNLSRWGQKFIRAIDEIEDCPPEPINYGITVGIPIAVVVGVGLVLGGGMFFFRRRSGRCGGRGERRELVNEEGPGPVSLENPLYGINPDLTPQSGQPQQQPQQQQQQIKVEAEDAMGGELSEQTDQQQQQLLQQQQQPQPQQHPQPQQIQVKCEPVGFDFSFEKEDDATRYPNGPYPIFPEGDADQAFLNVFSQNENEKEEEIEFERK